MARPLPPLTYGKEESYEQKYEKYKKYQEILFPRHHHKKCPTCYVIIHNRAGRCEWCKQALEATKEGNKTFKECRAALETLKREIERTDEKNIDLTLAIMQAKVIMKYRPDHYIWHAYPFYKRPEVNLGPLKKYKQVTNTDYQKNQRFLKEQNNPNRNRLKAPRTISEHIAIAIRDEKRAKKEEEHLINKVRQYVREDRGLSTKGDRGFAERQLFYNLRIKSPKNIGSKDISR